MTGPLGDVIYLTTFDRKSLFAPDDNFRVQAFNDFGSPPVDFQTRKGYHQHGATEVGYTLAPRTVSIAYWAAPSCTREEYWRRRTELLSFVRHNRGGPIVLTVVEAGGAKRALVVRANPGFKFPEGADRNTWDVEETLDFVAFDPIWFDPTVIEPLCLSAAGTGLIFPITFPITFGSSGIRCSHSITYLGTWESFPTLELTGPFTGALIEHVESGYIIELVQAVTNGDKRVITLTPGSQSIVDSLGVNKFSDLGPSSNLVDFKLLPDPEMPGGIQTIQATFLGATSFGSVYAYTIQHDSARRYYRLSELSGLVAYDSGLDNFPGTYDPGTITDTNGTYHGGVTLQVAGPLNGGTSKAARFDGVNGYIDIPTLYLNTISFSVELWVKRQNVGGAGYTQVFSAFDSWAAGKAFYIALFDTGVVGVDFYTGTPLYTAAGKCPAGVWTHIVVSYTVGTDTLEICVNGVSEATGAQGPLTVNYPLIQIGVLQAANYFKGDLGPVLIYQVAVTAARAAAHYAAAAAGYIESVRADYPIDYFGLDDNLGSTVAVNKKFDLKQGQSGALVTDSNPSVLFDGFSGAVAVPSINFDAHSFSVEVWIYPISAERPVQQSIFNMWTGVGAHQEFNFGLYNDGSLIANFLTDWYLTGAGIITFDAWNYVVMSYDVVTGRASIYVNSVLIGSGVCGPYSGTSPICWIGAPLGTYIPWFGKIDELALYDKVLTATQVLTHYQIGKGLLNPYAPTLKVSYYNRYFGI
jgi:hypothetical protein